VRDKKNIRRVHRYTSPMYHFFTDKNLLLLNEVCYIFAYNSGDYIFIIL